MTQPIIQRMIVLSSRNVNQIWGLDGTCARGEFRGFKEPTAKIKNFNLETACWAALQVRNMVRAGVPERVAMNDFRSQDSLSLRRG